MRASTLFRTSTSTASIILRPRIPSRTCLTSIGVKSILPSKNAVKQPLTSPLGRLYARHYHSKSLQEEDTTIYALSTASGRAAIAVIRISGPACRQIYHSLCPSKPFPKPRHATLRKLYSPNVPPSPETLLDSGALVLYFPAPNTVTGEDVLELHVHGGPAIVRAVLAAIPRCASTSLTPSSISTPLSSSSRSSKIRSFPSPIRPAEPGEFTLRAFLNTRLTLPQVESLSASLTATTEQQRLLSVRGSSSTSLSVRYEHWRSLLLHARGELEALIDFSEDQHFDESPQELCTSVAAQVRGLVRQIEAHVTNAVRGELLRNGISVALLGAPNAGKSSLLNRIVGREAAIVSQQAGTTRDVVEVGVDLGGWLVKLGDMAGLRRAGVVAIGEGIKAGSSDIVGAVEQEGIKRAKQRALESDVLIVVQDATARDMDPEVTETAKQCVQQGINVIVAINKIDQIKDTTTDTDPQNLSITTWKRKIQSTLSIPADRIFPISCKSAAASSSAALQAPDDRTSDRDPGNIQSFLQDGLIRTFQTMTTALVPDFQPGDTPPDPSIWQESLGATERQRVLLSECLSHLQAFLTSVDVVAVEGHDADGQVEQFGARRYSDEHGVGVDDEIDIVIAAECLRRAAEPLARITGRGESGDVEEVLGVVFEKFCVGK